MMIRSCARMPRTAAAGLVLFVCLVAPLGWDVSRASEPYGEPEKPHIEGPSDEGTRALAAFRLPAPIKASLFAAEPRLANPVAICVDHRGRVWVCESFRQSKGVEDNRGHGHWLDDDLVSQTVEDRIAYYRAHLKDKAIGYTKHDDRIRLLEDRSGGGQADYDSVFADHFNHLEEGTAAGILVRGEDVFLTNIPNLWRLRDPKHTGQASERTVLSTGYGVRTAFRGHDLHGLVMGPDGRLYFSIGDRGFNVPLDGKRLVNPESGGVLRCNPDGSELEVFYTGLRNPQKLAFDDYGNLFTDDNNSDSGDKARWTYLVEGGDSGWRMAYQYLSDRGPFNREKLWHPFHAGQAAYINPCVANIASGPSGLACYPGTGLGEGFAGAFFLVDFRGSPRGSGVMTVNLKPKGAFFEVAEQKMFWHDILASDLDFGPDGYLYVSDWVAGWNGEGKGRIYRAIDPAIAQSPAVKEVKRLLGEGFAQRSPEELVKLLRHADRRVRQEAQFALVERKALAELTSAAKTKDTVLARVHAIWGLGQLGRKDAAPARAALVPLLGDAEAEVVAQAASVLGELKAAEAFDRLLALVKHPNLRVRYFAAAAVGKLGRSEAIGPLLAMLAENGDQDPVVRHGGIVGLAGTKNAQAIVADALHHASPAARVAAVVALRRLASEDVVAFLNDADANVVLEAARAIYDAPIPAALPKLAERIGSAPASDPLVRRILAANYRLGQDEHAERLAAYASQASAPVEMRVEALALLAGWEKPSSRDRVLGMWRPIPPRAATPAIAAVRRHLAAILSGPPQLRSQAAKLISQFKLAEAAPELQKALADKSRPASERGDALIVLADLKAAGLDAAIASALQDEAAELRIAARQVLARHKPDAAVAELEKALARPEKKERQAALALLAEIKSPPANAALSRTLDRLLARDFPEDCVLDLLTAARGRNSRELQDKLQALEDARPMGEPLVAWIDALHGGDAERGERIFREKSEVSCVRCHKVRGQGGEVGPDLSQIGGQKDRRYLLEAICEPNRTIAKGFETVIVTTDEGRVLSGVLKGETPKELTLITPEAQLLTIPKSSIERRTSGKSAMPDDVVKKLTPFELRDLIEFLANLK